MEQKRIYDYLIVGVGLAGICFTETILENNKTAFVIGKASDASSRAAAGVFNAVILKRFTLVNHAQAQIDLLNKFYSQIEAKLDQKILSEVTTLRKLSSTEEQNNFIVASDRPLFQPFLSSEIIFQNYEAISAPFGWGLMKQTGYVDTTKLIDSYVEYLRDKAMFLEDWIDYSEIVLEDEYVSYKGKKAKKIIFCEGFRMRNNPYFNNLPLEGAKGELLIIEAKDLKINFLIKAGLFVLPIGRNLYKVGATYNWEDKTDDPTQEAKIELLSELKQIINCDFKVIDHLAGVRPTVKDRKPLVGQHPLYKNMYLLNGLGTRGVMLAPYLSEKLFNFIEFEVPLEKEISIDRFFKK